MTEIFKLNNKIIPYLIVGFFVGAIIYTYFGWAPIGGWIYKNIISENYKLFSFLEFIEPDILKGLVIMFVCLFILALFFVLFYFIIFFVCVLLITGCAYLFRKISTDYLNV